MVYIEVIFARMITEVFMTLKEKRESYNLSQAEAAKIIGVPVRTLRRYESN
ncbi:MAG: helix-turn-helix transcriptional regulator, partial [Bacilli bacterium]|nr:helix-turn-helix transcriptional regulator [Bacilli bacterium]